MPHREAASMGLPVITQRYSGLDDGFLERWAVCVLETGQLQPIPKEANNISLGVWMKPDLASLVDNMLWCYNNPVQAAVQGKRASQWIAENQTWEHSARILVQYASEGSLERTAV